VLGLIAGIELYGNNRKITPKTLFLLLLSVSYCVTTKEGRKILLEKENMISQTKQNFPGLSVRRSPMMMTADH